MSEEHTSTLDGVNEHFPKERYEALEELGRGANGVVFLCRDRVLKKKVAIKILLDATNESVIDFQKEAKIASSLSHRSIIKVLDFSAETGQPYLVMDYLVGKSLNEFIMQNGPLGFEDFRDLAVELCEALSYAHGREIVHRDLKPANIMLTEGGASPCVILDFGLARKKDLGYQTLAGTIIGTPLYMSPEQSRGEPATRQSDIYSLGCIFNFMLKGKPPYDESEFQRMIMGDDSYEKPVNTGYAAVNKIIEQMLQKDRHQRYATTLQVKIALQAVLDPIPTYADAVSNVRYTGMFTARRPKVKRQAYIMTLFATCFAALVLFFGMQFSGLMNSRNSNTANDAVRLKEHPLIDPDLEDSLRNGKSLAASSAVTTRNYAYAKTFKDTLAIAESEWANGAPRITYPKGTLVEVDNQGTDYRARVLKVKEGIHLVSYIDGGDQFWDEWVPPSRIHKVDTPQE